MLQKLKELIKFRKKPRELEIDGFKILYAQIAIQQERSLASLNEVMHNMPLGEIKKYLKEVYNGSANKKNYEAAKQMVGKPKESILRENLLNYKNKAYVEFLEEKYRE